SQQEFEYIRDFIILHYHVNERDDTQFWRDLRHMDIPDRLREKIAVFRETGALFPDHQDIFLEPSWLQVLLGQGVMPADYHPLAGTLSDEQLIEKLRVMREAKRDPLAQMPTHDGFLELYGARA
ncbi:MAG: tryptophan 7-halogenase, partial [Pseudomonadota bacterium]